MSLFWSCNRVLWSFGMSVGVISRDYWFISINIGPLSFGIES